MKLKGKGISVRWFTATFAVAISATASASVSVYPDKDVFDAPPPAASAAGKRACQPAQRYVDLMTAERYDEVGKLFAIHRLTSLPLKAAAPASARRP